MELEKNLILDMVNPTHNALAWGNIHRVKLFINEWVLKTCVFKLNGMIYIPDSLVITTTESLMFPILTVML